MNNDDSLMRRFWTGLVSLPLFLTLLASGFARAEILPTIINTGVPLAVECSGSGNGEGNLSFGTISIASGNTAGSVSVAASSSATAIPSGNGISVSGSSRPALCTVTDVVASGGAAVSLSGGEGNGGTYTAGVLSGVKLKNANNDTLDLELNVDKTNVAVTGSSGIGKPVYIGGTLSIPAGTSLRGTFTADFTITVTE